MCKRRHRFAATHSVTAAVQESITGEPAALVTGAQQPAIQRVDRGRMQVPVPEINYGAASVLAL